MFLEPIDLTDSRYSEKANLEYAVMKLRQDVIDLEVNPTTDEEYRQKLETLQYYWRVLNEKYPWKG